jgi:hypothetical protein
MSIHAEAVATYIDALAHSRDECTRSEDRLAYTKHLAAAAEMSAAAHSDDLPKLLALVASEGHGFGWSYLSGEAGAKAERAFSQPA